VKRHAPEELQEHVDQSRLLREFTNTSHNLLPEVLPATTKEATVTEAKVAMEVNLTKAEATRATANASYFNLRSH
jgi:hypothetical protein